MGNSPLTLALLVVFILSIVIVTAVVEHLLDHYMGEDEFE